MNNQLTSEKISQLKKKIINKRESWNKVRLNKQQRKSELHSEGPDVKNIRRDKIYKRSKKEQGFLSKEIRHLEKKLNRLLSLNYIRND